MQGYKLSEGQYRTDKLNIDKMWDTFNWLFSSYSRNDTSYKFIFFKSIIDCIDKKDGRGRITFDVLFERYTRLAWPLVLKYKLAQKAQVSDGRKSILENILNNRYDSYIEFDELFNDEKSKICREVKQQCKKYVVGALYGDTDGYLYSFSKKEEWIELNPVIEKFIKDNQGILENLNYYKWAQFYEHVNDSEKIDNLRSSLKIETTRKNESLCRTVLAQEFEVSGGSNVSRINTLDLLMAAEETASKDELLDVEVEEELYKDSSHMRFYVKDPIQLINKLKKEKGIF